MVELSGITQMIMQWVITPLFWLLLIIMFAAGVFFILVIRKKKKLIYPTIEVVDLGRGKVGFNNMKSGWFGKKLYVKGLWWSGEEVLRTDTGERIEEFSTEDFQEVDGERGIICYRDPLNQNILMPINRTSFKNKELVAEIAPASYRDAAIDIFNEAIKETSDWKEKIIQFVSWALVIVFSLVAIIVIVQYVKAGQDKAADLLIQAGTKGTEACKEICREAVNIAVSKFTAVFLA